jgi:Ca2+-binding EF-hand superfamily protein
MVIAQPPAPSFAELDADGDGFLSKAELADLVKQLEMRRRTAGGADQARGTGMLERMFSTLDTDQDGQLSETEFKGRPGAIGNRPRVEPPNPDWRP